MPSLFAIIARDVAGSDDLRAKHREGHLAHFRAHADRIAVAGPLGGEVPGSLVIFEAESSEAVRAFIEGDPFYPAGVWESVEIASFKAGSGRWAQS